MLSECVVAVGVACRQCHVVDVTTGVIVGKTKEKAKGSVYGMDSGGMHATQTRHTYIHTYIPDIHNYIHKYTHK